MSSNKSRYSFFYLFIPPFTHSFSVYSLLSAYNTAGDTTGSVTDRVLALVGAYLLTGKDT